MTATRVLSCEPDDPALTALLDAAHGEHLLRYPELRGALRGALEPGIRFLLARADGAPASGCCAVQPLAAPGVRAGAYELKRMFVSPAARGRGVGLALLRAAEALAAASGARWMYLETGVRHTAAVRLYERAGYLRVPPYPPYLDDPFALCYAISLADKGS
jgi:putative acetyltransferase